MAHVSTRAVTKTAMGSLRLYFQAAVTARPVGAGGGEITMQKLQARGRRSAGRSNRLPGCALSHPCHFRRPLTKMLLDGRFAKALRFSDLPHTINWQHVSQSLLAPPIPKEHGNPHQEGHQVSFSQHLLHRIAWPYHPGYVNKPKRRSETPTPPMQGEAALALQCPAPRAGCCTLLGPIPSVCCACRWEAIPFGLFCKQTEL